MILLYANALDWTNKEGPALNQKSKQPIPNYVCTNVIPITEAV